jgi:lysophospholipase L1-like esterase
VPSRDPFYATLFGDKAPAESAKLASLYGALAVEFDCAFFDASKVATAHPADGVHLDAANTRAIGQALIGPVRALLDF